MLALPAIALVATAAVAHARSPQLAPRAEPVRLIPESVALRLNGADEVSLPTWDPAHGRRLRVCADPNNLPFSNARGEGFENRIARMVADDIGARVEYEWHPQRRGFVRTTLKQARCDVVMGVPDRYEMLWPTAPYYTSTYVFVTRRDRGLAIHSLDDPALRRLRIGVHAIGDDYANSPAALALSRRGLGGNVVGYSIYGDYSKPDPPADLVRAVEKGAVDVAIVWGPLAGWLARRDSAALELTPVTPRIDLPFVPFVYSIAAGTRRGDTLTHEMLERSLARHRADIRALLDEYGVPLVEMTRSATPAPDPGGTNDVDH